ncbi:DinB family protein [compost metagenome]
MLITVEEFLTHWEQESESTQKILDALTDESLKQEVSPKDRTLGRIAWHIVTSLSEMIGRTGLKFEAATEEAQVPQVAREIAEAYRTSSAAMVAAMRAQWNDAILSEEVDMYGEMWTIANTLDIVIKHEIHHRGQMTVLMRQAGLTVPGVYGPSRDDWAAYGEQPPEL